MSRYSDVVNVLSPVAYWRLGESEGVTAEEETGDHDGTYLNSPTLGANSLLISDPNNTAVDFTASSSQGVQVTDHADLRLTGVLTLAAWIKVGSSVDTGVLAKMDTVGEWNGWALTTAANGKVGFWTRSGGVAATAWSTTLVNDNKAHFVVGIYNGTSNYIYIDGGDAEGTVTGRIPGATAGYDVFIAQRNNGYYFDGIVDEPAVFDYALSQAQVQNLYNLGLGLQVIWIQDDVS